jgi:hypothetical protein
VTARVGERFDKDAQGLLARNKPYGIARPGDAAIAASTTRPSLTPSP